MFSTDPVESLHRATAESEAIIVPVLDGLSITLPATEQKQIPRLPLKRVVYKVKLHF